MKIFFDTEFTGLRAVSDILSIGMVAEDGSTFYSEIDRPELLNIDDWIRDNVIANFTKEKFFSDYPELRKQIEVFLSPYKKVEMWSDCLAYDWVLFCELWSGALNVPDYIYYIPFDICTLMKAKGIDPDINREEFSGITGIKHNALHDAKVIKACYEKLLRE